MLALLTGYLGLATLHFAAFSVMSLRRQPGRRPPTTMPRVAVLVPACREGAVLVRCVESLLASDYPSELLNVIVIADRCPAEVCASLAQLPVTLHEVSFVKSTKARALQHALAQLDPETEVVAVLDADNLAHPDFVRSCVAALSDGAAAVQGARLEKNRQTPIARLDAAMERIHHAVYRQGRVAVGLSAALAGSGMAFHRQVFAEQMAEIDVVSGFDKQLELGLLCAGERIAWAPDAIVFDEKVSTSHQLGRQRRRWLSAQGVHLRRGLVRGLRATVRNRSLDPLDKLAQWMVPPRSLHLLALVGVGAVSLLLGRPVLAALAAGQLAVMGASLAIAAHSGGASLEGAWSAVPAGLGAMLRAAARVRGAEKRFIHTEHDQAVSIDTVLGRL